MREMIGLCLLVGGGLSSTAGFMLCLWSGMSVELRMGYKEELDTYRRTSLGIKLLVVGAILGISGYFLT